MDETNTNSIPSVQPPPGPKYHLHPKIWLPILVVVAAAGGYLIYIESKSAVSDYCPPSNPNCWEDRLAREWENQIANWKTYRNEEYGFEFKYPLSWTVKEYTDGYNNQGSFVLAFTTGRSPDDRSPFISVKEDWSAEKEINKINTEDPPYTAVKSVIDTMIGSLKVKAVLYSTTIGLDYEVNIVSKRELTLIFGSYPNDNDLRRILATLKFTK